MSLNPIRDRFESLKKRDFKSSLTNLLEKDYKLIGSRKIIELLSVDIEDLHNEYYPHRDRVGNGEIVLRTTKDDGQRQSYGKKTEKRDNYHENNQSHFHSFNFFIGCTSVFTSISVKVSIRNSGFN